MPAVTSTEGPVAVTGASGFVGSQVVIALVKRGYTVHACVREANNPHKTDHLLALNNQGHPGKLDLYSANLLDQGSYDGPLAGCSALLHVGTAMGYGGANNPQQVYDGAINGTGNVLDSVKKVGTVKRVIYTSSFAAIGHPASTRVLRVGVGCQLRIHESFWRYDGLALCYIFLSLLEPLGRGEQGNCSLYLCRIGNENP